MLTVTPTATGLVLHNQHHWVTESGDTILLNPADATAYTTPDNNRFLGDYLSGIEITGGTGAFEGRRAPSLPLVRSISTWAR